MDFETTKNQLIGDCSSFLVNLSMAEDMYRLNRILDDFNAKIMWHLQETAEAVVDLEKCYATEHIIYPVVM